MEKRTVLRTALDKFFDNALTETVASFVNFCNDSSFYNDKELKFLKKMPINNNEKPSYDNRFLFKVSK